MRAVLQAHGKKTQLGESHMEEDTAFHSLIAEATGNEILKEIMDNLMGLLRKTREASVQHPERAVRSLRQHRAILKAMEARKPEMAERHMREHIREIEELVFATQVGPPEGLASSHPPAEPAVAS